jgi:aminopeptidase N
MMSYGKGACVARMLGSYIGEEALWNGLRQFLHTHCYSTAVTEDFWKAFR